MTGTLVAGCQIPLLVILRSILRVAFLPLSCAFDIFRKLPESSFPGGCCASLPLAHVEQRPEVVVLALAAIDDRFLWVMDSADWRT